MQHSYEVKGMHCKGCTAKLTQALGSVSGVTTVEVTLSPPRAVVGMDEHVPLARLEEAAQTAGGFSLEERHPVPQAEEMGGESEEKGWKKLTPLLVVVGYITGGVLLRAAVSGDFSLHTLMANFMGGFFVAFSLFKLIDLPGFADGYQTYDLVARRSRAYALSYPFLELGLGVAYLTGFVPVITNVVTLGLMSVGAVGVARALSKGQAIQCACLGTALKLPMTKVTLVEDAGMAGMALGMLLFGL